MYLAGWPIFLALVIELMLVLKQRFFKVILISLLLIYTCLSILRNRDYASEISLWEDTVKKSPNKARVHNNLGYAYLLAHRNIEARQEFVTALKIDPGLYKARYNLYRVDDEIYTNKLNSDGSK